MGRKSEYKPLLFTTTLRNPERIKNFLEVLARYEGEILTNEVINKIVYDLISSKEYIPVYVNRNADLKSQLISDGPFSGKDTNRIILNSPQKHKESGFDRGWPSRFDTWYKFIKELGLAYYEMDKPIEISSAGKSLLLANKPGYEHLEQQVFLNSFVKYQRNNPFRRIKNSNKPLILLLKTILKLREIYGNQSAGISINEVPFFICWKDDDYEKLSNFIVSVRKTCGYNPSDEYIYAKCKDILDLDSNDEKRFKISNICHELPDEFIRKMRMTGLISIRGAGHFIDINNQEISKVEYIVKNYAELHHFSNEREYYDYVKEIDAKLVSLKPTETADEKQKRNLFLKWVSEFSMDVLKKELNIVCDRRIQSKNEVFKFINEPLRLEFLTALTLQKKFTNVIVRPNYSADDEGMPTFFAPGNCPDITCIDDEGNVLFEVTLIRDRSQVSNEMIPIERHLIDAKADNSNSFSVFLAPNIHPDTLRYAEFAKFNKKVDIIPLSIPDFVNSIDNKNSIFDYR